MFIAKTTFDKKTLIAIQKKLNDTSRTGENDLIALEYTFDMVKTRVEVLRRPSIFDVLIRYTFFWTLEYRELILYQHVGVEITQKEMRKDDGTPIWGCFLGATLRTWIEYCESDHPKKFIAIVKNKLVEDGYSLRLGRNICHIK